MRGSRRNRRQRRIFLKLLGIGLLVACSGPSYTAMKPPPQPNLAPFEIRVWADQKEYRIGEPIALFVVASADAYVTLIETDAGGDTHVLFPNEFGRDHFLAGGRRYEIPGQNAEYRFSVEGPAGTGQIRAIASLRPLTPPGSVGAPDVNNEPPLGESSTHITIIDDDRGGSDTLRERSVRPKRPERPIDIIGMPGNQPNLVQEQDEHPPPQISQR